MILTPGSDAGVETIDRFVRFICPLAGLRCADAAMVGPIAGNVAARQEKGAMMAPQVLVVDDSRTVRVQLERILSDAGFEISVAGSGKQALELVAQTQPHLMILDIQMPEMDGYAVCQELKRMGAPYDRLPVLFLTSLESHALDLLGHAMGAYLQKPIVEQELLTVVNRFVDRECPAAPS